MLLEDEDRNIFRERNLKVTVLTSDLSALEPEPLVI
jgi:hypothetical protein